MEEWNNMQFKEEMITPLDNIIYTISQGVIEFTQNILLEYGKKGRGHEGMVYWAGSKNNNSVDITMAIAPWTISNSGMVRVPHLSNLNVILELSKNKLMHIGQIHSHPEDWVGHSPGDDEFAAFKTEGLLSVVAPNYGRIKLDLYSNCGIHRYMNGQFPRLSYDYIKNHFRIENFLEPILIDQRNERIK